MDFKKDFLEKYSTKEGINIVEMGNYIFKVNLDEIYKKNSDEANKMYRDIQIFCRKYGLHVTWSEDPIKSEFSILISH